MVEIAAITELSPITEAAIATYHVINELFIHFRKNSEYSALTKITHLSFNSKIVRYNFGTA